MQTRSKKNANPPHPPKHPCWGQGKMWVISQTYSIKKIQPLFPKTRMQQTPALKLLQGSHITTLRLLPIKTENVIKTTKLNTFFVFIARGWNLGLVHLERKSSSSPGMCWRCAKDGNSAVNHLEIVLASLYWNSSLPNQIQFHWKAQLSSQWFKVPS